MRFRGHQFGLIYGLLLTVFSLYVLLDTFVIQDVQQIAVLIQETTAVETELAEKNEKEPIITDSSYEDENIQITLKQYREYDSDIYVAEVILSDAAYLKTAFAKDSYGRNVAEKTSEIAGRCGAILAVNGDYYGVQEHGYVLRNRTLYRSTASREQEDLVIWEDGSFGIFMEGEASAEALLNAGASQILSFGPALVEEGEILIWEGERLEAEGHPRTAIAAVSALNYLFVVVDGRTDASEGLTLYELAEFLQSLGAETAYNLDGGGSSTMYFNGKLINNPTSDGRRFRERSVSDIVYIG